MEEMKGQKSGGLLHLLPLALGSPMPLELQSLDYRTIILELSGQV